MKAPAAVVFGLLPALATVPVTALRAWLEVRRPDVAWIGVVSAFVPAIAWLTYLGVRAARRGGSFKELIGTAALFALVNRGAIGAAYALAWTVPWTRPDGGPTRYALQVMEMSKGRWDMPPDASFLRVWSYTTLFPCVAHVLFPALVFAITRGILRLRRGPGGGASTR